MSTVNSMTHWRTAAVPEDGPSTTVASGVKRYLPSPGGPVGVIVNVRPWHAVPGWPEPVAGFGTTTPGSQDPTGQSAPTSGEPQLGTSVIEVRFRLSFW